MRQSIPGPGYLLLIIGLLSAGLLTAQKAPIKYGKISLEDLKMKFYPLDSTAEAVVLCDYGRLDPNQLQFTRTIRIKILKKEGTKWANLIIPSVPKSAVKGTTYNLESGKVNESKLKNESVFSERLIGNLYRMRIGMPNVKEGSVVEITYSFIGIPNEWEFQKEIPVQHSEIRLPSNPNYEIKKVFSGYFPLSEGSESRWVAENVPAFHPEPYINSVNNYLTKFKFELAQINFPGYLFKDYSTSWDAVYDHLKKHPNFGDKTRGLFIYLSEDAQRIDESFADEKDKIIEAYETIRRNVKWDETYNLYADDNLGFIYNNKKLGSSADMNFLLYQLIRKLNIEAYPMVMSTRDNGVVNQYFSSLSNFNHVIVYVKSGENICFLDATDRFVPADLLPENCLNGSGFVIAEEKGYWVEIPSNDPCSKTVLGDFVIDHKGNIKGEVSYKRTDYAAARFREQFDGYNSKEEYIDNFEKENGGCVVTDFNVEKIDSIYLPVIEKYEVEMSNKASLIGNILYIEPVIFERISENPFRRESREYPVDFTCPHAVIYAAKFAFPEEYTIEQIPEACRMYITDKSASFSYQVVLMGKCIQVIFQYSVNKAMFLPQEYPDLKEFYNQMVIKLAEPIILKAKENES
jgi:hypothetical protein